MSKDAAVPVPASAPVQHGGAGQTARELFAGTVGGVAQVLTSQPFDTVKVRLQALPHLYPNGAVDCIRKTIAQEGYAAFYKGTTAPLIGIGACVSIQFGVVEGAKRAWKEAKEARGESGVLGLGEIALCGALAGAANTVVSSPVEHFRIRMQLQTPGQGAFSSPVACAADTWKRFGIRGVYKGVAPTLLRETIGYGGYFFVYDALKRTILNSQGTPDGSLSMPAILFCGGMAGFGMWIPAYPADIVKSMIQGDSFTNPKYRSATDAAKQLLRTEGPAGFLKGFAPCMARAVPVNAVTFLVFEYTMKLIS